MGTNTWENNRTKAGQLLAMHGETGIIVVQGKLNRQKPTKVYSHDGCYVERAMERLTVITMRLCRDSA
jgi:hypothetical protein